MLISESESCPDCGCDDFYLNRSKGETICKKCALVVDDSMLDTENYIYTDEAKKAVGAGVPYDTRVVDNLRTNVGKKGDMIDINRKVRNRMERLRKVNLWNNGSYHATMRIAFDLLSITSSRLSLPKFVEKDTADIFRRCVMKGLTRKRSIDTVLASALYVATRIHKIPKSMSELSRILRVDKSKIGKTSKEIIKELGMKSQRTEATDYVPRFASELNLSAKVQTRTFELIEKAEKKNLLLGLSPLSIAGTFLYIASLELKERRTQKELAEIADITEATLRTRYKRIMGSMDIPKAVL